jgi:flavin reductase (DIM6/NTAB) family NADH-FMN oxidoreductase RutF
MDGSFEGPQAMDRFTPGPDTARAFRDALGRFATGVTVVTAQGLEGPVGITVNSFASVSLEPPLVLWSPAKASSRFPVFARAEHFAIHILGADQRDLAAHFTRHGREFDGLDVADGPGGTPLIGNCLACFACRRYAAQDAGDHVIILGEVLEGSFREGEPLVFSQGFYGSFAKHE